MNSSAEHGRQEATKQAGRRGGVWSISEVLSELLPRYDASPTDQAGTVIALSVAWNSLQTELVSCS